MFALLLCWIEEILSYHQLYSIQNSNISLVKGLMLDSISASEKDTENGICEFSIQQKTPWRWTEAWPTLVQQL